MGYDRLSGTSSRFRFGPFFAAAVLLGLGLGLTMPLSSVSAGVPNDANAPASLGGRAEQALPSDAARAADAVIVVADKNKNKNGNNNNNKNVYVNKKVVVVRPYRPYNKKNYYGRVIGGVALGTVLGAAAYSAMAPAPGLCWYWADPSMTQGYWDYC
jgi:hypothetical protein